MNEFTLENSFRSKKLENNQQNENLSNSNQFSQYLSSSRNKNIAEFYSSYQGNLDDSSTKVIQNVDDNINNNDEKPPSNELSSNLLEEKKEVSNDILEKSQINNSNVFNKKTEISSLKNDEKLVDIEPQFYCRICSFVYVIFLVNDLNHIRLECKCGYKDIKISDFIKNNNIHEEHPNEFIRPDSYFSYWLRYLFEKYFKKFYASLVDNDSNDLMKEFLFVKKKEIKENIKEIKEKMEHLKRLSSKEKYKDLFNLINLYIDNYHKYPKCIAYLNIKIILNFLLENIREIDNSEEKTKYSPENYLFLDYLKRNNVNINGKEGDFEYHFIKRKGHLICIQKNHTAFKQTLLFKLNNSKKKFFDLLSITALHETYENWKFCFGENRVNGKIDFYCIKQKNTESGTTEIHILSGEDNYQSFIYHGQSALHETDQYFDFCVGDFNHDGYLDLFCIKKQNSVTRTTEVHILSGKTKYLSYLLETKTNLHETDEYFEFYLSDYNGDGFLDIICVKKKSCVSGFIEVHVLSGKDNYQSYYLQTPTELVEETDKNIQFGISNFNGNDDLFCIYNNEKEHSLLIHQLIKKDYYRSLIL